MRRFLITTALEETWRDDEPVLFLGEWCRRHSRKDRWSQMDAVVLPYHWDDRSRLHSDYNYLLNFYERLLQDLSVQLNQIHGVDHSARYWRILVGPWLGYFTQILFDRWTSIHKAIRDYELSETIVLTGREESLIPPDMAGFPAFFISDEWNQHIFDLILREFTSVRCKEQPRRPVENVPSTATPTRKQQMKQMLAAWCSRALGALRKDNDAFFMTTYLPLFDELKMQVRLKQWPQLWRSTLRVQVPASINHRKWVVRGESRSEFEKCARTLIPRQMPPAYLEAYGDLCKHAAALPWPRKPRLIWTSNSFSFDDVFKMWAAQKVEEGTPLVIGQHGGTYGMSRWSFAEDHETAISDCFLSWGWSEPGQSRVKSVGQLKAKRPIGVHHEDQPIALMVGYSIPRMSYHLLSGIVSRQWLDYFRDQCSFVEALPASLRKALIVRLYPHDFGWDQAARWHDRFPDVEVDEGQSKMQDLIRRTRVYIATYNATTYLESFTMDIPTIVFWDPEHWELRESAIPYFEELQRAGIFHETPESAARHVAAVWNNVDAWWTSPAVVQVLKQFKKRYCDLPSDLLDRVENALGEVLAMSGKTAAVQ